MATLHDKGQFGAEWYYYNTKFHIPYHKFNDKELRFIHTSDLNNYKTDISEFEYGGNFGWWVLLQL